ncbi:hypothetical protein [Bradyrhizobium liaoningense]
MVAAGTAGAFTNRAGGSRKMDKGTLDDFPGLKPAAQKSNIDVFAEMGLIPPVGLKISPRPASSYRAARRNHVKTHRQLPAWRNVTAAYANQIADIAGRRTMANGAREAAAKALADTVTRDMGLRQDVVAADAMLSFYDKQKRTRSVNRIIRSLEAQIRAAATVH